MPGRPSIRKPVQQLALRYLVTGRFEPNKTALMFEFLKFGMYASIQKQNAFGFSFVT
jgi:hypothetical protein